MSYVLVFFEHFDQFYTKINVNGRFVFKGEIRHEQ